MAEAVKVFIRVRPPFDFEVKSEDFKKCISLQENVITLSYPRDTTRDYCFDGGFHERTSETQVFEAAAKPLVESVLSGYSGTLFVYGQTGTGKTHTMGLLKKLGPKSDGIVPRSVRMLIEQLPPGGLITLSFLQIYMENIYDLLNSEGKPLPLREDPSGEVFVQDLVQVRLQDTAQALALINTGLMNRIMGSQNANQTSSRSHIVLLLNVSVSSSKDTLNSRLTLVDLAGSERVRKTSSTGLRLDEAKFINASLSTLGKVISSLVSQNSTHIPYRDSKLTRVLKPSLSGGARMVLIATVGPAYANGGESLSTLQFASRCKEVILTPAQAERKPTTPVEPQKFPENRDREDRLLARIKELEDLKSPSFSHVHSEAVIYLMKLVARLTQTSIHLRKEAGRLPASYLPETDSKDEDSVFFEEISESILQMSSEAIIEKGQKVSDRQYARKLADNLTFMSRAVTHTDRKVMTSDPSVQLLPTEFPVDPMSIGSTPKQPAAKRSNLSLKELLKGKKTPLLTPSVSGEKIPTPQRKPSADSSSSGSVLKEEKRPNMSRTPEPTLRSARRLPGESDENSESISSLSKPAPPKRMKSVTPPKRRDATESKVALKPKEEKAPVLIKDDFLSQLEDELQKIGGGDDIDDWLRQHAAA